MKVYVDELPKSCIGCPFCQDIKINVGMDRLLFCKANKGKAIKNIEKSFDKCIVKNELQSLTEHDKQIRNEVVQEIKEQVVKLIEKDFKLCNHEYANGYCYGLQYDLAKILDQIENGGINEKIDSK